MGAGLSAIAAAAGAVGERPEVLYSAQISPWVAVPVSIAGFVILFGGIWTLVCLIVSSRGWGQYAKRFAGATEFPAGLRTYSWMSMMIGGNVAPANYRNSAIGGVDGAGLHLRMSVFFRMFHPPVMVPWDAMDTVSQKSAIRGVFTAVEIAGLPRLVFFGDFGDAVFAQWQSRGSHGEGAQ